MAAYARRTQRDLTVCMHSTLAYMLSAPKAKMAARLPPTPPPRVTAAGVDSSGPIGRAHKGINFCPRAGYDWAYLKRAPTQPHICPGRIAWERPLRSGFRLILDAQARDVKQR